MAVCLLQCSRYSRASIRNSVAVFVIDTFFLQHIDVSPSLRVSAGRGVRRDPLGGARDCTLRRSGESVELVLCHDRQETCCTPATNLPESTAIALIGVRRLVHLSRGARSEAEKVARRPSQPIPRCPRRNRRRLIAMLEAKIPMATTDSLCTGGYKRRAFHTSKGSIDRVSASVIRTKQCVNTLLVWSVANKQAKTRGR